MINVLLIRTESGDQGTFSYFLCEQLGIKVQFIELPDRNNKTGMSRIPAGEYLCSPFYSKKFGKCWIVNNVPGRAGVLIHCGNFAGDTLKGWKTHSRGCLLPGWYRGWASKQKAILNSQRAMTELRTRIGRNSFKLKIIELC